MATISLRAFLLGYRSQNRLANTLQDQFSAHWPKTDKGRQLFLESGTPSFIDCRQVFSCLFIKATNLDFHALLIALLILTLVIAAISLGFSLFGYRSQSRLANTLQDQFSAHRAETDKDRQLLNENLGVTSSFQKTFLENIASQLKTAGEKNDKTLEEVRATVNEKLQDTLEKRLGETFKRVGQQLTEVHQGLGQVQSLVADVGDLKRVMGNIKMRGTWGEVQLANLLEQTLPGQYEKNVAVHPETSLRVDFAIRLPGKNDGPQSTVWLPIDSKFPQEDFIRIQEAAEAADEGRLKEAKKGLEQALKKSAEDIQKKYIRPPQTTDFAIMFLATEGLYAEALRMPQLIDELHRRRIVLTGPMTLAATLNSLAIGFQTLAIERNATAVQETLGKVKTEFSKFGGLLTKAKKQLQTASNTLDDIDKRAGIMMNRALKDVEASRPEAESSVLPRAAAEDLPLIAEDAPEKTGERA